MVRKLLLILIVVFTGIVCVNAQKYAYVHGKITDKEGKPVSNVNVFTSDTSSGTVSNNAGNYRLKIPAEKQVKIKISHLEYIPVQKTITAKENENIEWNTKLEMMFIELHVAEVEDYAERIDNLVRIDPKAAEIIPSISGGIESVLIGQLGVNKSGGELSSQYSVRGGNFDENLVYVNDIEVYRPFLTKSGQQEGLSFVNTDMVSSIQFSSGGFEAAYGDKMSSVLDIEYKKPYKFAGSASASLLGGTVHIEDCSDNYRFSHITGIRYKTNSYVFNSLDVKGEYDPSFVDFQTYITFEIDEFSEINLLGNYAHNQYNFIPVDRRTTFGTVKNALGLNVYYDGMEKTSFETYFGALSYNYSPKKRLNFKFIASAYNTFESETYDIQGQYYLNELDKQIGSDNLGDSLLNIGIGTYLEHARNYLDVSVFNFAHKGNYRYGNSTCTWGGKIQQEMVNDKINEWIMRDSAGFSLPFPDTAGYSPLYVSLYENILTSNNLLFNRAEAYIQNTYTLDMDSSKMSFTMGVRGNYLDFTNQLLISPRASLAWKPDWERDYVFRLSGGYYFQPPFYKELRDLSGNICDSIKAQKSIHLVLGGDYNFRLWERPFKFITEIYYKYMDNLIPYQVENVRIRYYGDNNAHGYSLGIDMKINGEFVPGVDSWASLSIMQTEEDIEGDYYYEYYNADGEQINPSFSYDSIAQTVRIEPGYIPRPSDQTVNFGLFFQDYLPKNPSYKMQLSLLFGSRLPFGPPSSERYTHTNRMPAYRRVDIGFSKVLKSEDKELSPKNPFRHFKNIWLTAEVFNLLGIKNTISYLWLDDIYGRQYAVPNYLSARRLNIKLTAKF